MNMIILKKNLNPKSDPALFKKVLGELPKHKIQNIYIPNCGQNKKHEARGKKQNKNLVSNFWRLASGTMNTILSL